jgi:signal transduction histidine kinase
VIGMFVGTTVSSGAFFNVMPARGWGLPIRSLVVTVWSGRQCIELRIRDQGPGMTAESGSTHSTVFGGAVREGSGLGLAKVRKLVQIDDGDCNCHDAEGGGLEVLVRLPSA